MRLEAPGVGLTQPRTDLGMEVIRKAGHDGCLPAPRPSRRASMSEPRENG